MLILPPIVLFPPRAERLPALRSTIYFFPNRVRAYRNFIAAFSSSVPLAADRWLLLSIIFGWIGLFANLILVTLYLANPKLRIWPGPLIILMAFVRDVNVYRLT